jgi:hypothetical protein
LTRHHRGSLWITCLTLYRDWKNPLTEAGRWTPIFFLDDAVALAAGHRPCGLCRREDYLAYRAAVARFIGRAIDATDLNRRLANERLRPGAGLERARDRRVWEARLSELPVGTVVVGDGGEARLVLEDRLMRFEFDGWADPISRSSREEVLTLTPPTSVAALSNGFYPVLHPSAR